ncbi:tRNA1(Val) (adenine(37)-N6)-methyltransferase [Hyphomicrobium sp.]|jgi:tRNA1(Val) A37 N6-methylase TrmN6|uniref:tRNA1(Val) (adenine(37)-N6)-methyltransferase n=1 Tax=Hyphomicrobium sp. TaxID=82 RepID=UPI00356288F7
MSAPKPDLPLLDAVSQDLFLGDALEVRQPRNGYRAGTDAVLLAATLAPELVGEGPVLDVGSGVGVVGLCVAARCPSANVVLLEREPALAAFARHNVDHNALAMRVSVVEADIARATGALESAGIASETFAFVLANPPYHEEGRSTAAGNHLRAASHQMPPDALDIWARFMNRMAAPGGRAAMIHKTEALPRILSAFEGRFGGISVLPVHARADEPAIRVIVTGIKGSRAPIAILPSLVLHGPDQAFLPEIEAVFRHGAALPSKFGG